MSYKLADLETRTLSSLGRWNWMICELTGGMILDGGATYGRKGEAHLPTGHAASMIAGEYDYAPG